MNNQEAFDKNWQHFVVEKAQPATEHGSTRCFYLMDDGRRCGIGILLTKAEAHKLVEKNPGVRAIFGGPTTFSPSFFDVPKSIEGMDSYFLEALQGCHDNAVMNCEKFHVRFRIAMHDLAEKYNLKVPA